MNLKKPDQVPVMCQPSWGFVLSQIPGLDPIDFWHNHDGAMARGFCEISTRFGFDGVMIPAVGSAPLAMDQVKKIDKNNEEGPAVYFENGDFCVYCKNDLPRYTYARAPETPFEDFDESKIGGKLMYHPPSNHLCMRLCGDIPGRTAELTKSRQIMGPDFSLHGSMYSPDDYLIDALGVEGAMIALLTEPERCRAILIRYAEMIAGHGQEQINAGVDAMNLSAPWCGQGFISVDIYRNVIAPSQKVLVDMCLKNNVPVYCHTCGAIGDRLEEIINIGFTGIECLDPPPLGNVELEDAVKRIGSRAFIKGNIDPVHMLLEETPENIITDIRARLETGMKAPGFILSTACAIAAHTPAKHVALLRETVDKYGKY